MTPTGPRLPGVASPGWRTAASTRISCSGWTSRDPTPCAPNRRSRGPARRVCVAPLRRPFGGRQRPSTTSEHAYQRMSMHADNARNSATCSLAPDRCLAGFGLGARFVALNSAAHAGRVALIWPARAGRRLWAGRGSRGVCAARSSGAFPARTPLLVRVMEERDGCSGHWDGPA
jgi:hypothetical protein